MILFGERHIKDVPKVKFGNKDGSLIQYDWCPWEKRKRYQRQTYKKKGHLKARDKGLRGNQTSQYLDLELPASRTVREKKRKKEKKKYIYIYYIYTLFVCLFKSPSQCVVFSYVSQTYSSAKKLEYDIKNIYINALKNNWKLISDVKNFYLRLFSSRNRP